MTDFRSARVTRRNDTIYIPLPRREWVTTAGFSPCQCGKCDGDGAWDTLAIAEKPRKNEHDFTWLVHYPELRGSL